MAIGDHQVGAVGGNVRLVMVTWDFDERGKIPNAVTPTGFIMPKDAIHFAGLLITTNPPASASGNIEVGWLATDQSLRPPGSQVGVGVEVADRNGFETISTAFQQRRFTRMAPDTAVHGKRFQSDVEITLYSANTAGSTQSTGQLYIFLEYILT